MLQVLLVAFVLPFLQEELVSAEVVLVELSDAESSREFVYEVQKRSVVYLYAESDTLDPILLVEDEDLEALGKDDHSGGGTSAYLELEGKPRDELWITLSVAAADEEPFEGEIRVKLTEVPRLNKERLPQLAEATRWIEESQERSRAVDLAKARELARRAVDRLLRFPEPLTVEVQAALLDAGTAAFYAQDPTTARDASECVWTFRNKTLPDEHPDLQDARLNLAVTISALGDLAGARRLEEKVLGVRSLTLPDDHPDLQDARTNLAGTIFALGDLAGARLLQQKVLEVRSLTLPDDHPGLQDARSNLAVTIRALGDLAGARRLVEKVLEVRSLTLPDDHPDLQDARNNLAVMTSALGDLAGARVLYEKVLEVRSLTLPDNHPGLQAARNNLAFTISALGDLAGALRLQEKVLEVRNLTLPDNHPDLQNARSNLAGTIFALGDLAGARLLEEKVLEVRSTTLPDDHPGLQNARSNLAVTIRALGDLAGARRLQEKVLEVRTRTLPDDHPDLQRARLNLAWTRARSRQEVGELIGDLARGTRQRVEAFAALLAPRELRVLTDQGREWMSTILSLLCLSEISHPEDLNQWAFSLVETMRGIEPSAMRYQRGLERVADEELRRLRQESLRANQALVRHSQGERSSFDQEAAREGTDLDRFQELLRAKETAESRIAWYAATLLDGEGVLVAGAPEGLAEVLHDNAVAIGYWRYTLTEIDEQSRELLPAVQSYLAHVLRADGTFIRVELGPAAETDEAVKEWRAALRTRVDRGVRIAGKTGDPESEAGQKVRQLIFDPLVPHLGNADRLFVALDDALHLVPLVALPDGDGVLGDRYEFSLRTTLRELTATPPEVDTPASLLALGGVEYDLDPELAEVAAEDANHGTAGASGEVGLRSTAWRDFGTLLATSDEVDLVAHYFQKKHKGDTDSEVILLTEEEASRGSLERLAPKARYLHLATHGYFLDESVPSMADERVIDERLGVLASRDLGQQVRGYLPMTLCGLALAGANIPANEFGRVPGILTAQELAGWNLNQCELAVLSACDSNVGIRRAGQGIASLQEALYAAGVRASITSLWKVPDRATQELFTEFYRRLWLRGENKAQALWSAQQKLRRAKDPEGNPIYRTRDWAAWVLVGDPN